MYRLFYFISILVIVIDQYSKMLIEKNMELYEQITVIEKFFWITSYRNEGAAWGILQGQMIFFYIITVIVVGALIFYLERYHADSKWTVIAMTLIIGGAIGNFIDRLFRGYVVDFLDFDIFTYNFPVFNIADSALVVGVGIIIVVTIFDSKQNGKKVT